ncbi:MAG TPA: membrane dipeptidase [Candidatus Binatia bacterium]|nr:membrane dipeptidase [Candidatus Binatia bacterium]
MRRVRLAVVDHRSHPDAWARDLAISTEAVQLHLASDVIDLHVDSFIWTRVFGYDLRTRHGAGLFGGDFLSQVDFPRILEAGVTGAIWSITTNPLRSAAGRGRAFAANLARLRGIFASVPEQFALVRSAAEYRAARAAGKHGAFVGIQGGNAIDRDPSALDLLVDDLVVRVTLVHLSSSSLGATSAPTRRGPDTGLTGAGREMVRALEARRVLVDLAHVSRRGFFDAVEAHDRSRPLVVTHTGVSGVHPHWRNLDDEQLRAIADSGGTIGVMYHSSFLCGSSSCRSSVVVDHLAHIVDTVGEDHASLGSDWDGTIMPPTDMKTCLELPRLVQHMLDRGWSDVRIRKILGENFLRVLAAVRG